MEFISETLKETIMRNHNKTLLMVSRYPRLFRLLVTIPTATEVALIRSTLIDNIINTFRLKFPK